MSSKSAMDMANEHLLQVYNRFPVVFERGEGVRLFDENGKSYLDFGAGIAVMALGYGNQAYADALKTQIDKLTHTSNLFYNIPMAQAARKLSEVSEMDRVFFTNSGTEAVEGAIKAARKYAFAKDGKTDHEIISFDRSFHGRSIGSLSVTGNPKYQEPFRPLMGGVKFARFNDFDSVKAQVTDKTCAIILEPVQGEGGIWPADPAFLRRIRALCDERDILLIFDEIQCGMGRCGSWFACQSYGVRPDIMTTAKALGCGMPIGAFLMNEKCAESSLKPGDHGSTCGGNPLACAAALAVFDQFEKLQLIEHVQKLTGYLEQTLDALVCRHACLKERHGMGFMQGIEVEGRPVSDIINRALEKGLILLSAEGNVLRFVPPLVIEESDIDEMAGLMDASLA